MIETRHLRHLLALAEHRHYARAADALHLTQPALTRSIQALEASLEAQLFDRGRGEVTPTAIGHLLLDYARDWALAAQEMVRDVQLAKGAELGALRIGAGPFAGASLVGLAVGRLSRQHPQLRVEIVIAPWQELPERLRARDIDLMLAELSQVQGLDAIEVTALKPHPPLTVCRAGHPLTALATPTLAELLAYPWAGPQMPQALQQRLAQALPPAARPQAASAQPLRIVCDSAAVLKDVLLQSDAISMMPAFMVAAQLRSGELQAIAGLELGSVGQFGIARLRGRSRSAPEGAFIELLLALDAQLRAEETVLMQQLAATARAGLSPARRKSRRSATAGKPAS
ncbi:MAG: LysR family transcriptional regulator [Ottowia sp.]|nr:LysR family transcriptional regulator [Ottowia sp.]